jgi:Tfp pilus assembly protein PilW
MPLRYFRARLTFRKREPAFIVLELLVAFALVGIVLITASTAFNAPFRAYMIGKRFADEQENARLLLERMTRRIRLAGLGAPPAERFTEATVNSIAFQADLDADGSVEKIRYCLDSTQGMVREQLGSGNSDCTTGAPLLSAGIQPVKVVLLEFAYFDGFERQLAVPPPLLEIARVRTKLGLDSNRSGTYEASSDLTFEMDARVRNYAW